MSRTLAALFCGLALLMTLAGSSAASIECIDFNAIGPVPPTTVIIDKGVIFTAATLPSGASSFITIDHIYPFGAPDADLDLGVPWSQTNLGAANYADILFDPAVYGAGVDFVQLRGSHTNTLELWAYDAGGAVVAVVVHAAGAGNLQTMSLAGAAPIQRVEIRGAEIALTSSCFDFASAGGGVSECIDIAATGPKPPAPVQVVDGVEFHAGVTPGGLVSDISIDDNFTGGGDGILEINVPWTELNTPAPARYAKIVFPAASFGAGVKRVELLAAHFNRADFRAFDRTGAAVSLAIHPGPQDAWRRLVLTGAGPIRTIEIIGAELGIQELCYEPSAPFPTGSGCVDVVTAALPIGAAAHNFTVDDVEFFGSRDNTGAPMNIVVTDNLPAGFPDGLGEFFYGWSLPGVGASQTARILFPPAHFADGPAYVEVVCAPSTTMDLVAYDKSGAVVASLTHTAGPLNLETLVFNSPGGIRRIEIIGTQCWVTEVCWADIVSGTPTMAAGPSKRAFMAPPTPNPFNPRTAISFRLDESMMVELDVFDARGRQVKRLHSASLSAGEHRIVWDGTDAQGSGVSSGLYMFRLRAGDEVIMKRATLLK